MKRSPTESSSGKAPTSPASAKGMMADDENDHGAGRYRVIQSCYDIPVGASIRLKVKVCVGTSASLAELVITRIVPASAV